MRSPAPCSFIASVEIRDRTFENQRYRASGLNLVVAAIILWNTVYLGCAVEELRSRGENIPDEFLAHVAPLGWSISRSTAIMFGLQNRSKPVFDPYETRAPNSSVRLSVRFGTDSTMTPSWARAGGLAIVESSMCRNDGKSPGLVRPERVGAAYAR
jgi:hypothetical protein